MTRTKRSFQVGFTLIEMIVALAVFSVVVTIAVGALLALISTNEQLQSEQSVMTNLSFALDSMAREIRTGTNYYCDAQNNANNNMFDSSWDLEANLDQDVDDCPAGRPVGNNRYQGISFIEGGDSITAGLGQRITYYHDEDAGTIYRRVGNGGPETIVSSGIYITDAEFYVSGTDVLPGEESQASVTIYIEAKESADATGEPHRIQTSITQRTLDI